MKRDNIKFNQQIKARVLNTAQLILDNNLTVRDAAKRLNASKSTIHKDVAERLPIINPELYGKVRNHLNYNMSIKHIRGGQATKMKFKDAI
ncbi:Stage III sporulation protein D [compost metagenome]